MFLYIPLSGRQFWWRSLWMYEKCCYRLAWANCIGQNRPCMLCQTNFKFWCWKPERLISELYFSSFIGYQGDSAYQNYSRTISNEVAIFLNISGRCIRGTERSGRLYTVTSFHSTHWLTLGNLEVQSSMFPKWMRFKYLWIT